LEFPIRDLKPIHSKTMATTTTGSLPPAPKKKPVSWRNLAIGAVIQTFEVSTLGAIALYSQAEGSRSLPIGTVSMLNPTTL
jgi:hypothetical protein